MVRQNPGMQRESLWGVSFSLTEGMFQSPAPISRGFHKAKNQEVRVWWLAPDVVGLGLGQQMSGGVLAPWRGGCGVFKASSRPGPAPPAQVALLRKAATSLPGWASPSYPPPGDPRDA